MTKESGRRRYLNEVLTVSLHVYDYQGRRSWVQGGVVRPSVRRGRDPSSFVLHRELVGLLGRLPVYSQIYISDRRTVGR